MEKNKDFKNKLILTFFLGAGLLLFSVQGKADSDEGVIVSQGSESMPLEDSAGDDSSETSEPIYVPSSDDSSGDSDLEE